MAAPKYRGGESAVYTPREDANPYLMTLAGRTVAVLRPVKGDGPRMYICELGHPADPILIGAYETELS